MTTPRPYRHSLRKYEAPDEPLVIPERVEGDGCRRQAPTVDPMPPLCKLAKHSVAVACEASGVTDGIRWHVQWWPVGWDRMVDAEQLETAGPPGDKLEPGDQQD